jgi:hypothetical protein
MNRRQFITTLSALTAAGLLPKVPRQVVMLNGIPRALLHAQEGVINDMPAPAQAPWVTGPWIDNLPTMWLRATDDEHNAFINMLTGKLVPLTSGNEDKAI